MTEGKGRTVKWLERTKKRFTILVEGTMPVAYKVGEWEREVSCVHIPLSCGVPPG